MAKLVSMKVDKKDRDAKMEATIATESPAYPYGLCLTLDDDALEKLGLEADDFAVGKSMTLVANVDVTSVSSYESKGTDARESVSLQITDLCLEDRGSKAADLADAMYKKD